MKWIVDVLRRLKWMILAPREPKWTKEQIERINAEGKRRYEELFGKVE
jgi:hypothetical protein